MQTVRNIGRIIDGIIDLDTWDVNMTVLSIISPERLYYSLQQVKMTSSIDDEWWINDDPLIVMIK